MSEVIRFSSGQILRGTQQGALSHQHFQKQGNEYLALKEGFGHVHNIHYSSHHWDVPGYLKHYMLPAEPNRLSGFSHTMTKFPGLSGLSHLSSFSSALHPTGTSSHRGYQPLHKLLNSFPPLPFPPSPTWLESSQLCGGAALLLPSNRFHRKSHLAQSKCHMTGLIGIVFKKREIYLTSPEIKK